MDVNVFCYPGLAACDGFWLHSISGFVCLLGQESCHLRDAAAVIPRGVVGVLRVGAWQTSCI